MTGFSASIPDWPQAQALSGRDVVDRRADSDRRQIQVLDSCVVVDRQVAGVRMRVRLPTRLFRGVALVVGREGTGEPLVSLVLIHPDPELDVTLYQAGHDGDVAAEWQHWAERLGLPLLVCEPETGSLSEAYPRLGALRIEAVAPRRRPSSLSRRRPRFLSRRRAAALPEVPVVHRGREIIART